MSKISIIVPVYNTGKYLRTCLDSIVNQTISDKEIIVVDDASTDNSLDILKEYAFEYPFFKLYHNEKNQGQGVSRNIGLSLSTGDYIGFVDSDDCVELTMYETMYNEAVKNDFPDVITVGIRFVDDDNLSISENFQARWPGHLIQLNNNPMQVFWESPSCCNKIFKKELIGNYKFLEKCTWEDVAFTYSLLMKANNVLTFPDNFYLYRRDITRGVSSKGYKPDSPIQDMFKVADEIEFQAKQNGKEKLYKEIIPLLQMSFCLQRFEEIEKWNIEEDKKDEIILNYYELACEKYGGLDSLDKGLLSSKTDIELIDKLLNKSKLSNIK